MRIRLVLKFVVFRWIERLMKLPHTLECALGHCGHNMADITRCVICGADLVTEREQPDTCGKICRRQLLRLQRERDAALPDYPYAPSPADRYELTRDGKPVLRGTEGEIWRYLHRVHSGSVSHALKHEGYTITAAGS